MRLTIVTPVGPGHEALAARAQAAVRAQSVPCAHLVIHDDQRRGPGWARNQGLAQVRTPFVSFLDADDQIAPEFAARTLAAFDALGGRAYIYTDWQYEDGRVAHAADCPWTNAQPHVVTALIPTDWARAVDGFDERLPGGEDTEFYLRLIAAGACGRRLPEVLFVYGKDGTRSRAWRGTAAELAAQVHWSQLYGGQIMGCCDGELAPTLKAEHLPGDVLARPTWFGNRRVVSAVTGRNYGRIDGHSLVWIDPRDLYKGFALIEEAQPAPIAAAPARHELDPEIARLGLALGLLPPPPAPAPAPIAVQAAPVEERAARLMRLIAPERKPFDIGLEAPRLDAKPPGETAFFVRPDKLYPSYDDFWTLVKLAGYTAISPRHVTLDNPAETYVFVTPEAWPDVRGAAARCIAWELEYAGDYTHDTAAWAGDIWASDPAWAKAHGARFVLMGSDARLKPEYAPQPDDVEMTLGYDVTMLGYMTGRRVQIKGSLPDLRWTQDYPSDPLTRHTILSYTRLMLHVHQHDGADYIAPLRIALAAAYRLPVISETVAAPGPYHQRVWYADYGADLTALVRKRLRDLPALARRGAVLHDWLCVKAPFAANVAAALGAPAADVA